MGRDSGLMIELNKREYYGVTKKRRYKWLSSTDGFNVVGDCPYGNDYNLPIGISKRL